MWRKLTLMLFLFVLARTASALPIPETPSDEFSKHAQSSQVFQIEQQVTEADNDEPKDLFNLPRVNRLSPPLFSTEIQTTPNYVLIVEFFKVKLSAGLFKNLANPPLMTPWFEQLSHKSNSSRLSGWKDGNSLYSSRTTYHD